MEIYTYQVARWRAVKKQDIIAFDTTVKSGIPFLAPWWDIVLGYKNGRVSEVEYTQQYLTELYRRFENDPALWDEILQHPRIALGCYCPSGKFCHRHLLAQFIAGHLTILNEPFELKGEVF